MLTEVLGSFPWLRTALAEAADKRRFKLLLEKWAAQEPIYASSDMFVVKGRTFEETSDMLVRDHRRLSKEALHICVNREWSALLAVLKRFEAKKKCQLSTTLPANFISKEQVATLAAWSLGRFKIFSCERQLELDKKLAASPLAKGANKK